ncbi:MAG: hypothetical protein AAFR00_11325 [Pseudomonadota bacterium]
MSAPPPSETCLVDAHVHLYPGVDLGAMLTAAARHMAQAAHGAPRRSPGILILTETAGLDLFAGLIGPTDGWTIAPTAEPVSVLAMPRDEVGGGSPLALVSGRQIVTAENIEVHALGTRELFADGVPAAAVLTAVQNAGALAVLPWGVGKWSGVRAELVRGLISRQAEWPGLMLADSGVRPAFLSRPVLLAEAEAGGLTVLAGSDPLPLAAESDKPGRYGFVASCCFDPERPFAALAAWLRGNTGSPETYGTLEGALAFLCRQVAMQVHKRLR